MGVPTATVTEQNEGLRDLCPAWFGQQCHSVACVPRRTWCWTRPQHQPWPPCRCPCCPCCLPCPCPSCLPCPCSCLPRCPCLPRPCLSCPCKERRENRITVQPIDALLVDSRSARMETKRVLFL